MKSICSVLKAPRVSSTPPKTVDLPASSGTPVEIDATGERVAYLTVYSAADFYFTWTSVSAADGATKLGDGATRGKLPAGKWSFPCAGNYDQKFYIKSQVASATTDGLVIMLEEAD